MTPAQDVITSLASKTETLENFQKLQQIISLSSCITCFLAIIKNRSLTPALTLTATLL